MGKILAFLIFLLISFFAYWFLVPKRWRSLFLFLCSLFFISSFSIKYTFYFLFNTVIVYVTAIFISKESKIKKLLLQLILIWLIGSLCFFKYTNILLEIMFKTVPCFLLIPKIEFPMILLPLGMSYITFRLIHYIIEMYRKGVPRSSFVDFALYVLFFPTFLAGPVERFYNFHPQTVEKRNLDIYNINYGLFRIICGVIKKTIIADNLAKLVTPVLHSPEAYTRLMVIFSLYIFLIRVYMDFSGYTDMAIGVARLFGYKIMENFNRPFFQKNIALFWRNWHISVYSWIRDYFFFPLFGYQASNVKIYFGIFCTMLVFMLWHKGSLTFLFLAVYHGLGLAIWYTFQGIKIRYPLVRQWVSKRYLNPVSTFFTFSFVVFSGIFFRADFYESLGIIKRIIKF